MTPTTPSYAARVWLEGDRLYCDLPVPDGEGRHTLCFPNDPAGLSRLLFLIRHRTAQSRIGEPGDITQHQLNKELAAKANAFIKANPKRDKPAFTAAARSTARDVLRKMGMI